MIVFLLLINLRLLVLHLFFVLFFFEQDLILVILLNLLNRSQKVLMLTLLLSLQFGEFFGVVEHSTTVLVSLLLDLVLLLVQEFPPLDLFSVL